MSFDSPGSSLAVSNATIVAAQGAGIIVVASCGNGTQFGPQLNVDMSPNYPACYPIWIISSLLPYTARDDTLGSFSDFRATNVVTSALLGRSNQLDDYTNYGRHLFCFALLA